MSWRRPRGMLGQLTLLMVLAFFVAQAINILLIASGGNAALRSLQQMETIDRAAAIVSAIDKAPPGLRDDILAATGSRELLITLADAPLVTQDSDRLDTLKARLQDLLPGISALHIDQAFPRRIDSDGPPPARWWAERLQNSSFAPAALRLSAQLSDGSWLNIATQLQRPGFQVPPFILGTTMLSFLLIVGAVWLGIRRITGPLRRLASAADAFDIDSPPPALPQKGPEEVRALSEALARMHARVADMVAQRTTMLTALGHDLRSPLTALRVRAEMVEDDETRERMIAILGEMQEMVETTLAFARGISADQPSEDVDLAGLVDDVARTLAQPVAIAAGEPVIVRVRVVPMRRALRNLIENAQKYGSSVSIALHAFPDRAEIHIDDNGPGIPPEQMEHVFEPFTRLEASRSRDTGGIGLGLPIARAILRAHGGEVTLHPGPSGRGTRALVTLPLPPAP